MKDKMKYRLCQKISCLRHVLNTTEQIDCAIYEKCLYELYESVYTNSKIIIKWCIYKLCHLCKNTYVCIMFDDEELIVFKSYYLMQFCLFCKNTSK